MVQRIPDDYPQVTPYLCVHDAEAAIAFYTEVFGGNERLRIADGDKVGHVEIDIGDGLIMLSDEYPDMGIVGPRTVGGTTSAVNVYVEDVDAVFQVAIEAGAEPLREPENHFYGDRSGQFLDPFGHRWSVATHVEDVSQEELRKRAAEAGY